MLVKGRRTYEKVGRPQPALNGSRMTQEEESLPNGYNSCWRDSPRQDWLSIKFRTGWLEPVGRSTITRQAIADYQKCRFRLLDAQ